MRNIKLGICASQRHYAEHPKPVCILTFTIWYFLSRILKWVENRERLVPLLSSATASFSKADLLKNLEGSGVPAGPINTIEEAFNEPQFEHRKMRVDLDGVPRVRTPIIFQEAASIQLSLLPNLGKARSVSSKP